MTQVLFTNYLMAKGFAKTTIDNYNYILGKFFSDMGGLKQENIERFLAQHNTNHVARTALQHWVTFKGIADINIPKIKGKRGKDMPNYLTPEQVDMLVTNMPLKEKLCVLLLFEGGLRAGELFSLLRYNINFERNELRGVGKGNKPYIVNFTNRTATLLKQYIEINKILPNQALFPDMKRRKVWRFVHKAGIKVFGRTNKGNYLYPHILRHSCAMNLLRKGVDLRSIQEYLRHENLETVAIYTKLERKDVIEKWKRAFENV